MQRGNEGDVVWSAPTRHRYVTTTETMRRNKAEPAVSPVPAFLKIRARVSRATLNRRRRSYRETHSAQGRLWSNAAVNETRRRSPAL